MQQANWHKNYIPISSTVNIMLWHKNVTINNSINQGLKIQNYKLEKDQIISNANYLCPNSSKKQPKYFKNSAIVTSGELFGSFFWKN